MKGEFIPNSSPVGDEVLAEVQHQNDQITQCNNSSALLQGIFI
ncbi:hypothetical protein T10_1538 [Trichinella papuae]|uniref:Uncharacterized protein n=1 Tax=Trichinella papuae TaxID=268474 RepID=A0A0V1LY28_9BILA|nr:hypothetical protein T10_1538 [Trichinella papuae]